MVTVHGRTRQQFYTGRADWDFIAEVKRRRRMPVIANGDITTEDDAAEALRAVGRGRRDDRARLLRPAVVSGAGRAFPAHRRAPSRAGAGARRKPLCSATTRRCSALRPGRGPAARPQAHLLVFARPAGVGGVPRRRQSALRGGRGDRAGPRLLRPADRARRRAGVRARLGPSRRWRHEQRDAKECSSVVGTLAGPRAGRSIRRCCWARCRCRSCCSMRKTASNTSTTRPSSSSASRRRSWRSCALSDLVPEDSPIFLLIEQVRHGEATVSDHDLHARKPPHAQARHHRSGNAAARRARCVLLMLQDASAARTLDRQLTFRSAARSVTGMAAILAHEVKNPLSGIRGAAQLLETSVRRAGPGADAADPGRGGPHPGAGRPHGDVRREADRALGP